MALDPSNGSNLEQLALKGLIESVVVYKGKRKCKEATEMDNRSPSTPAVTRGQGQGTTAGEVGWLLNYEPGRRIQRLEFQFHSQHRRKPTGGSVAVQ